MFMNVGKNKRITYTYDDNKSAEHVHVALTKAYILLRELHVACYAETCLLLLTRNKDLILFFEFL